MLKLFSAAVLLCVAAQAAPAQTPATDAARPEPAKTAPADASARRRETFETVWRTVNENHFDPTFGGLDWAAIGERYRPLAAAAKTDAEFYDVLRRMVGELKLSHFAVYPPGAFDGAAPPSGGASARPERGSAGLDVRILNSQAVVTRIDKGSAAERAGLRTGHVILKVDKRDIAEAIARLAASELSAGYKRAYMHAAALGALAGPTGAKRVVTYLDERDRRRETELTLLPSDEEMSEPVGVFPGVPMRFETRRFGEVGYVHFNIWVVPQMEKLRRAVRELSDTRAIVFDLRGNPGGLGIMATGLAGLLSDEGFSLGTLMQRRGHMNFLANPQPGAYRGAVVVLVDGLSASTSEVFALGMQESGRVAVVGETTAGAALPSIFTRLPTGATFQFAFADFKTPKGVRVEGRGAVPDVPVSLDRRSLLAGRDAQLDAALRVARERAARR
ncbi:MAG TPA: S41 family peptidase [Pyrinomonadaceae bacterium]